MKRRSFLAAIAALPVLGRLLVPRAACAACDAATAPALTEVTLYSEACGCECSVLMLERVDVTICDHCGMVLAQGTVPLSVDDRGCLTADLSGEMTAHIQSGGTITIASRV